MEPTDKTNLYQMTPEGFANEYSVPSSTLLPLPDVTPAPQAQKLQNSEVYTLINSIPLNRWKEFVRRLGLSDYDIDISEQENKRIQDAQYAMLRIWMDRVGAMRATKDAICRVLRDMELGGCIERIQESL
ncbi:tumor necrosis factor receptor superfamily member 1A isoform X2 [Bombina bombina]|nr:tumor necrosis factor receptor superfamily member 1A isoform X2 [Bombina bombina]